MTIVWLLVYFLLQQVAGYVTEYDVNGFKFVTVKGSGHMVRTKVLSLHKSASGNSFLIVHPQVPQFRPEQAFAMFERFIKDQPF